MPMRSGTLKELFSSRQVHERIRSMAARLNEDYAGKDVVMICVLKGAFMFFAELVKHTTFRPVLDFVRLSSYGKSDTSAGAVAILLDAGTPLAGKDVILVEDIVDTGLSMDFLKKRFLRQGVKSLRIAALIDKVERREVPIDVDYPGFSVSSGFIVGFGLDYAEHYRELPAIYTLRMEPAPE